MTALGKIIASMTIAGLAAVSAQLAGGLLPDLAALAVDAERMAVAQTLLDRPLPLGPGPLDALQILR